MDERIIVIDRNVHEDYIEDILKLQMPELAYYTERGPAETDETKLQIIPYMLVTDGEKVLSYSRSKKGNEERLHAKKSLGFGGHLHPRDVWNNSFHRGAFRELLEETGIPRTHVKSIRPISGILDDSDPVGRVHYGAAFIVTVDTNVLERAVLHVADEKAETFTLTPAEILEDIEGYENWTKMAFEKFLQCGLDFTKHNNLIRLLASKEEEQE